MLISVSRQGEQGGADTSTHQHSEKPDEIAQWFNATETCAPQAYRVLMSKPDFAEPLAPRNLAIFDDALEHYGALDSLLCNPMYFFRAEHVRKPPNWHLLPIRALHRVFL